jgi:hypothetical protein
MQVIEPGGLNEDYRYGPTGLLFQFIKTLSFITEGPPTPAVTLIVDYGQLAEWGEVVPPTTRWVAEGKKSKMQREIKEWAPDDPTQGWSRGPRAKGCTRFVDALV